MKYCCNHLGSCHLRTKFHQSHGCSECRKYAIRAMIRVIQVYRPQKLLFYQKFRNYTQFFILDKNEDFIRRSKKGIYTNRGKLKRLRCWQPGRPAAHILVLFWKPRRRRRLSWGLLSVLKEAQRNQESVRSETHACAWYWASRNFGRC